MDKQLIEILERSHHDLQTVTLVNVTMLQGTKVVVYQTHPKETGLVPSDRVAIVDCNGYVMNDIFVTIR